MKTTTKPTVDTFHCIGCKQELDEALQSWDNTDYCTECHNRNAERGVMKTYRVPAFSESVCYIQVNATTEEEAEAIARTIDGGEFTAEECYDWRIGDAEETDYDPDIDNDKYLTL